MKSLKRLFALFISMLFLCVPSFADEVEIDGYIVKYKNMEEEITLPEYPVSLFGAENEIEYVIPNVIFELYGGEYMPYDAYYKNQWNLDMIKADSMWSAGGYGNGVRVGVIDTGIYPHKDLLDCTVSGKAFEQTSGDGTDPADTLDKHGHGTYVSSIIAGAWNEYSAAGIAKNTEIVPLRAFAKNKTTGNWGASMFALKNAVEAAVDEFDCDIINMSLGVQKGANTAIVEAYFKEVINYAYSKGAIIVAAVGNENSSQINLPAGFENVIGVASVDKDKNRSSFSNYNSSVYVTAPGTNVYAAGISGDQSTNIVSGTSFSCPTVAAVAALCKSVKPDLTNAQFKEMLKTSCEDLGSAGYDTIFGYGLVRCDMLLEKLLNNIEYYEKVVTHTDGVRTLNFYSNGENEINYTAFYYFNGNEKLESVNAWRIGLNSEKKGYALKIPAEEGGIFRLWHKDTMAPAD